MASNQLRPFLEKTFDLSISNTLSLCLNLRTFVEYETKVSAGVSVVSQLEHHCAAGELWCKPGIVIL